MLVGVVLALGIIAPIAFAYGVVTRYNPFIYINVLFTVGYGAIVWGGVSIVYIVGHIRNFRMFQFTTLLLSIVGLCCVWLTYVVFVVDASFVEVLSDFPYYFSRTTNLSYSVGRGSTGLPISGIVLYIFWVIEAILLVGIPVFLVRKTGRASRVYCEDCNRWARNEQKIEKIPTRVIHAEEFIEMATRKGFAEFDAFEDVADEDQGQYYQLTFASCKKCDATYFFRVYYISHKPNSDGKIEMDLKTIMGFHTVSHGMLPKSLKK